MVNSHLVYSDIRLSSESVVTLTRIKWLVPYTCSTQLANVVTLRLLFLLRNSQYGQKETFKKK